MTMKDKFPVTIYPYEQGKRHQFKATTLFKALERISGDALQRQLESVESDYELMLVAARAVLAVAKSNGKGDPRAFWFVGDTLNGFLVRITEMGFYLVRQNATFARDLRMSESSIKKIMSFSRRISSPSLIDASVLWVRYRNNEIGTISHNVNHEPNIKGKQILGSRRLFV